MNILLTTLYFSSFTHLTALRFQNAIKQTMVSYATIKGNISKLIFSYSVGAGRPMVSHFRLCYFRESHYQRRIVVGRGDRPMIHDRVSAAGGKHTNMTRGAAYGLRAIEDPVLAR